MGSSPADTATSINFNNAGALMSGLGSFAGGVAGLFGGSKSYNPQEQFDMRVQAAKQEGINPLAALGFSDNYQPSNNVGDSLSQMGQGVGRAINALSTSDQRRDDQMNTLNLRHAELENTLLASQIAQVNQTLHPPAPVPGIDPTIIPAVQFKRNPDGSLTPTDPISHGSFFDLDGWDFNIRNRLLPFVRGITDMPGYRWDPLNQEYVNSKSGLGDDVKRLLGLKNWSDLAQW